MAFLSSLSLSCAFFWLSALVLTTTTTPSMKLVDGRKIADVHVVSVESLFPKEVCVSSKDVHSSGLKVVNRHGPCSPTKHNLSRAQILNQDQLRVNWIRSRITSKPGQESTAPSSSKLSATTTTQIPANKGDSFGTGGAYVVTVGFGTPALQQTLVFDTGSVVTWIQCQPCAASCYRQQQPIFDPAQSSTYRNISCTSPYCSSPELSASTCSASGSTCVYGVQYGDGSYSQGYYGTDTLALTPADTVPSFRFGCGQYQGRTFGRVAGLMGLGRAPSSVVSQTDSEFGGVFSYCLPPTSSSTGRLTFGSGPLPSDIQYTPMLSPSSGDSSRQPFYFLELVSISVGGKELPIPTTVFSNAGTIIDSGTTVTYLPPAAYSALRSEFRARMSQYRSAAGSGPLDTCYDFKRVPSVTLPAVALGFRGASMDLVANGIVYPVSSSKACLAFAANGNDSDVGILGNVQQRTFDVVYDVPNLKIGFGAQGC